MGKIKVTIEKGADLFGAWAENIPGIYGEGNTVQEAWKLLNYTKSIMIKFLWNYRVIWK